MRWRALLAAMLLAGCPEDPPPQPVPPVHVLEPVALPSVATLVEAHGTVTIERTGKTSKAELGPVFEEDVITTGPASSALLRDPLGRELELGEDTRFRVGPKLTTVEVLAGDLSFSADDGGAGWSDLSVRTPFGVATLKDGAQGRLRFVDGGVSADVSFGTIEFDVVDGGVKTAKAGESLEVSFGSLEFDAPPAADETAPLTLVVEGGKPQVKRPGEKKFSFAKSEKLPPGSALQTGAGVARLEAPHVKVVLGASSAGVVEGLRTSGGRPTVVLSKVVGPLVLHFDGAGPAAVDLGDVTVDSGDEASLAVTQVGKKRRLEVRGGEAAVTVKGQTTTLKAGDAVVVDGRAAVAAPAQKPTLVLGAAPRVKVNVDGVGALGVLLPDETNRVQVARDAQFSSLLSSGVVGKTLVLPVSGRAPLFYRVLGPKGELVKQGRVDFGADTASARDTATRSDVVSETGQKATVFYQSRVPALTFNFTPQAEVKSWRFRLYRAKEGTPEASPLVDRKAPEPKLVLEPGVLEEGEFLWSATALDASGNERVGGRMNKLSVVYDNARTTLFIERPLTGERAAGAKAIGVAPRNSQLFLNGKLVRPDDAGRFSVSLGGADSALFRVVQADGTELYWLRRLKR